jgi:hypothetical protein
MRPLFGKEKHPGSVKGIVKIQNVHQNAKKVKERVNFRDNLEGARHNECSAHCPE